jgi:SnoaL-like domain
MSEADDRLEIYELSARYARALDHDLTHWGELFTEDAVLDYPAGGQRRPLNPADMRSHLAVLQGQGMVCQHLMANIVVEIDGDQAAGHAEARVLQCMPMPDSGEIEVIDRIADYDDGYARTEQGWRFTRRRASVRWATRQVVPAER